MILKKYKFTYRTLFCIFIAILQILFAAMFLSDILETPTYDNFLQTCRFGTCMAALLTFLGPKLFCGL